MRHAFRQEMYRYVRLLNYDKNENNISILLCGLLMVVFLTGSLPTTMISLNYQEKLSYFYCIVVVLLIILRILWKWYSTSVYAGIVEIVANYVNIIVGIPVVKWVAEIGSLEMNLGIFLIIAFDIIFFVTGMLIEKREKEINVQFLYFVVMVGAGLTILWQITGIELFIKIAILPVSMAFSLKIILYWLMLDTPYRRNLIKEFGPKDIDKSAIFVSKKKSK